MGNVEEISGSEPVKSEDRKPSWPETSKGKKGEFEKALKNINVEGSLVETSVPGTYRIERVVFGPRKCTIFSSLGSQDLSFSDAISQIGESGFIQNSFYVKKAYQK